ncbi:efflux RND transporter permease subunit [Paenibacillus radicis (ex Xue et al. 2023)]|uniref:Efflux RND transporter permease subunit n=1 Tax=Paenibacillus radicis (ex Xue et al. 2023) TaxID=2972489 RepID=A0ABT1Y9W8_9BACL|nr:efflux RND transporter permease subunit [Paenibacillus radicis (ex Xue et al. 2023)]MCR8629973.1 efflux RND transporter permease subunit [Paenibacillus radicis (ex Xue et al. 2023)]
MSKLTDFSMKNIAGILIIMLLLLGGGSYAATTLKVEMMPDISSTRVYITAQYTAPPKDIMEQITKPIEKAVSGLQGLKSLTSTSQDNSSTIVLEFEQGKKVEDAKREAESIVTNVRLPQSAEKPKVLTDGFASSPVYYMAVYGSDGMNQNELDKMYKDIILPGFESINGMDHVDSAGNQESVLTIQLDAGAINNYGLTLAQVTGLIQASLVSTPAGLVDFNGNTHMVRVRGQLNSLYNLENLKISLPQGGTLLLKQLAKVEAISESTFIARVNDQPAIGVILYKTKGANEVEFANTVDRMIAEWEQKLPGVEFHIVLNGATLIKESVHGMVQEGILGALLASLMIFLFSKNVRMTLIVLVSIPLSILITLLFMNPLGISLNIMTLGGLAIAVGRVVDDSIVVIENIYSELQKAHERNESVIKLATQQVSAAITSSTITTVGVFAPIAFVSGEIGEVFRPFALTLGCALLSSLLVALTVIPMLAKLMVMNNRAIPQHDESKVDWVGSRYKRALIGSLKHRIKTLVIAGLVFVLSMVLIVPQLAKDFMPEGESDGQIFYQIEMPRETSMETMNAKSKEIEAMLREAKDQEGNPLFIYNEALVGYSFSSERTAYRTSMFTKVAKTANANEAVKKYEAEILNLLPKGATVKGKLLSGGSSGGGVDFSYSLQGDDQLYLQQAVLMVREKMKEFPELYDITDGLSKSKSEVEVTVDENKAGIYGFTTAGVLENVHNWIKEEKLGDLKFDNVTYATKVMLEPRYKNSVDKLGTLLMKSQTGQTIQLNEIAKVKLIDAPVVISREAQKQVLKVTAKIDSKDKGGVSNKISMELGKLDLPPGVGREVKGVADDIDNSFSQMYAAMAASIFIVYLVMVLAFGNASAPFAILFSLPLAAIGGLLGLLVTGESLNITSMIGFLMLIGIVVTNAIVLIDRVQQLIEQGHSVHDSLVEAGMTRLRPIIMTAGATILALMPLALGFSKGTLISKGLAVVVIGGLTTSTLLTLVIVPIIYELIYVFKNKFAPASKAHANPSSTIHPFHLEK